MNLSYEKLGNDEADIVVVYLALMRSGQIASEVLNHIKENRAEMDCLFVTVWVPESEWGDLLTPWPEKEKAGSVTSFGGRAKEMYDWLCDSLIPQICQDSKKQKEDIRWVLVGYSLAGLFSLWAMYQTDLFEGIVSGSGSVWYPSFLVYAEEHSFYAKYLYMSLGDKEEKTRNTKMRVVGDVTRTLCDHYRENMGDRYFFEWNPGNHFFQSEQRMEKGFVKLLDMMAAKE